MKTSLFKLLVSCGRSLQLKQICHMAAWCAARLWRVAAGTLSQLMVVRCWCLH